MLEYIEHNYEYINDVCTTNRSILYETIIILCNIIYHYCVARAAAAAACAALISAALPGYHFDDGSGLCSR